ncbi:MAG: ISLre2 family transposase [Patescibacteria group bacterium]
MNSLKEEKLTFKEIERSFFEIGCEVAKMLLQEFLEKLDKELAESRNKAELRHKGSRPTSIKTLMGEVSINRTVYKRTNDEGNVEHIYLLDQTLGLDTIGLISPNLAEKILEYSCEMSFREVSQAISDLTNQTISHQGVWNLVQAVGEKQAEAEKDLIKAYKDNQLSGTKEVAVLFEEADGLWLSMQGKSRDRASKGRKELKISVVYEGWEKRYPLSKEYKTIEKMAFAGYINSEEMKDLRDAAVAKKYNADEIKYRILNGDGASWIKNRHDLETDKFQLDPYHLAKSVIRNVSDKKARRHIMKWLKAGDFEKVFKKLEDLKYESGGLANEIKKLNTLESYIKSNIEGIVPYKNRSDIELPAPPETMEYRNMGTMERQVEVFASRMKGSKSWSEKGATNLSKIIALKMCNGFKDKITALVSAKLPERFTERFEEAVANTKEGLKKAVKKSTYPLHRGNLPFSNCQVTNGRKAIRSMFDLKPFSEMIYR